MIFSLIQQLLPKHLLSRIVGKVAASETPWVKSCFIRCICLLYPIDMSEAERTHLSQYKSFNDFFTRTLKPGARPISGDYCSPADGKVAASGTVHKNTLIQSKGHSYSLVTLLGDRKVEQFEGGSFMTIYLAPHNYHRVHVPITSELHQTTYIPGDLFSVSQSSAASIPNLFARNERLVCRFRTPHGDMAEVLVGAMIVAGIKPVWLAEPYLPRLQVRTEMKQSFVQGAELGQFQMGSTVILVFSRQLNLLVKEGDTVQVGQPIAALTGD